MSATATLRMPSAAAQRVLVLAAVSAVAQGIDRAEVVAWLTAEALWQELTPREEQFWASKTPPPKELVHFSWLMEAVYVLGWALHLRTDLEPPTTEASIGSILENVPGPGDKVATFLNAYTLRSAEEILGATKAYHDAHASCRGSKKAEPHGYNIEVVQERHRALNWLVQCEDADWEHVATDT